MQASFRGAGVAAVRPVASRHRGQASTHRHLRVVCQAKDADSGHRGEGGHQQAAGEQGSARRAASPPAPPAPTASPPAAVVGAAQQSGAAQQPSYEKLCALMEQLITKVDATRTDLGCVFEVSAATALAGGRRAAVVRDVPALLEAAGLPHDAAAKRCIIAALIKEGALPEFRRLVMKSAGEDRADPLAAEVLAWQALPDEPSSAAEWRAEARQLGKVAAALKAGSEMHQAVLLLRRYSLAAVEATAEGTLEPLVEVALSAPDMRGTLGWPADLPLLVGHIGGSLRREVELDAPLRVSHEAGGALVVTEIKLSAAGMSKAKAQLLLVFRLLAWTHSVLGVPLPPLVGRIVVPFRQLREAERLLRGSRGTVKCSLPHRHGDITVHFEAGSV